MLEAPPCMLRQPNAGDWGSSGDGSGMCWSVVGWKPDSCLSSADETVSSAAEDTQQHTLMAASGGWNATMAEQWLYTSGSTEGQVTARR